MNFQASLSEFLPDIPWEDDVGTTVIRNFVDHAVVFISLLFHKYTSPGSPRMKIKCYFLSAKSAASSIHERSSSSISSAVPIIT